MRHHAFWGLCGSVFIVIAAASCTEEGPEDIGTDTSALTGAIFTTDVNGVRVNQNLFDIKEDVYLDGGPGDNAPSGAAALPEGDYYFQVTSPSGKTLLSSDSIDCREFHVDATGVISSVGNGCSHAVGVSVDHGGLTVQLFPYDDTPNPGGVYKVWVTNINDYDENSGVHGFIPADSKTDNFKVRDRREERRECCGNGILEGNEECDDGNTVNGDGCNEWCRSECGGRRTCSPS